MPWTVPQTEPSGAVDPVVLRRIDRLVGLRIRVPLSVAVGVEDERRPALRLLLVVRLVPDLRVEPALDTGGSEGRPQHVVLVEVHVTRAEARVNRRVLLRLRIVQLELSPAGRERKGLR